MDIAESFVKYQNKDNIVQLYNILVKDYYKNEHIMNEYISPSWDYISLNCPMSALAIKMIANQFNMDWRQILALQFYDQIYYDHKLIKMREFSGKKRKREENNVMPHYGHCVGFACDVDGTVMNGQTWDCECFFPDTNVFEYTNTKTVSHDGALGGAFISKNGYSVTWTGTRTKNCLTDGVPSPIFLFEAMNANLGNIDDFMKFENKFRHTSSHSLLVTDGDNTTYLERTNDKRKVSKNITLPLSHCNTFITSTFRNNIYDQYSLERIQILQKILKKSKITEKKINHILTNSKEVWIGNEDIWRSISAFIFNPKTYTIDYFDRSKQHSTK
jgi:hypothetical protein